MNNRISKANFADVMDINSGHALVFPEIDPVVKDILSRETQMRSRIQTKPEGMETFRWVEQTGIARNAAFSDPRSIAPAQTNSPTRVEKLAKLKCITSRITYGFFDSALTRNGTFSQILEQDMRDAVSDCLGTSNAAIYNGTDTSYGTPTTNQYFGIMTAITNTATFNTTDSIADQIGSQIAKMINKKFGVAKSVPTAIYMNPLTADLMNKQEQAKDTNMRLFTNTIMPGAIVPMIQTMVGPLPVIVDPEITLAANGTDPTKYDHKILIVNENQITRHYFVDGNRSYGDPVVFKLGLTQTLADDYVIFMADNVVVNYPSVAHCIATYTV